jgi:hypothetical protein
MSSTYPLECLELSAPDESVNHPSHYQSANDPEGHYEAIKVIRAWNMGFSLGNALKYICRAGKKANTTPLEDLKKARWYLDEEIKHRDAEEQDSK